uniref:Uncharacterized protein n=1 Tax=Glossina austeni TaxID=7395 RepID=A0A1A9VQ92_GLOAU
LQVVSSSTVISVISEQRTKTWVEATRERDRSTKEGLYGLKGGNKGLSLHQVSDKVKLNMWALQSTCTKETIANAFLHHSIALKFHARLRAKWEKSPSINKPSSRSSIESPLTS